MNVLTYTKTKRHRNSSRIWIEGNRLRDAGFGCGQLYEVFNFGDALLLRVSDNTNCYGYPHAWKSGCRTVSAAQRKGKPRPIIDLGAGVADIFPEGTPLLITFMQDEIIIERGARP